MPTEDSFKILRLRLFRPPPAFVTVPRESSRRPVAVPITLAVGVTDDYGVDITSFDSIALQLQVVDPVTRLPIPSISLSLDDSSPPSSLFTISGPAGPFHTLKTTLTFLSPLLPSLTSFSVLLSAQPSSRTDTLSEVSSRMRSIIGEDQQELLESWEGQRYVLMRALSGAVEIRSGKKGSEASTSIDKVQTIYRHIHLPTISDSPDSPKPSPPLVVVERPGLNNSTGQRLWDCAIGISCWLSLHPGILGVSGAVELERPAKRPRPAPRKARRVILELGAGSGLASLTSSRLLAPSTTSTIIATDVEVTVSSTLTENLDANASGRLPIDKQVLDWGLVSSKRLKELRGDDAAALTILGADILYNPESHGLLLGSMLALSRSPRDGEEGDRAFIAYKARTEGDDGFFALARGAGLTVERVWEWGDVSVWRFSR